MKLEERGLKPSVEHGQVYNFFEGGGSFDDS